MGQSWRLPYEKRELLLRAEVPQLGEQLSLVDKFEPNDIRVEAGRLFDVLSE